MGNLENSAGIFGNLLQLGGASGPQIRNNSGVFETVASDGTTLVKLRAATPTGDTDVATKYYADSLEGANHGTYATLFQEDAIVETGQELNTTIDSLQWLGYYVYQYIPAQNDKIKFLIDLATGNYALILWCLTGSNRGIVTVRLDSTVLGTMDLYTASTTYNQRKTLDFSVATGGAFWLSMTAATKNVSSSNYYNTTSRIAIVKTA